MNDHLYEKYDPEDYNYLTNKLYIPNVELYFSDKDITEIFLKYAKVKDICRINGTKYKCDLIITIDCWHFEEILIMNTINEKKRYYLDTNHLNYYCKKIKFKLMIFGYNKQPFNIFFVKIIDY